ncbi:MAG: hypothetical protein NTY09_01355 [bacterium]|nr:hypothetical protein [bacterium]
MKDYTTQAGFPASQTTLFNDSHSSDTVPETVSDYVPEVVPDSVPDTLQDVQPDTLSESQSDTVPTQDGLQDGSKLSDLADVIEFCKVHGFPADVVGRWVWIRFDEKPDTETRELLKSVGFRWVKIRGQWAHNCGYHSRRGKGNPRWKYGSIPVSALTQDDLRVLKAVQV